jgi:ATP-dependent helicase/nuclease subunit A
VLEQVDLATVHADGPELRALAARLAAAEGISDAAGTVAELAASALASDALREARAAARVWREVPVVAPVGDHLVEGFVDLLYETPDGDLVVVDWKTDRARTPAEVDVAMDRYRLQGAGYALALERAAGRRVAGVRFVFCRAGGEPAVEREVADLGGAVADAASRLGAGS